MSEKKKDKYHMIITQGGESRKVVFDNPEEAHKYQRRNGFHNIHVIKGVDVSRDFRG